MDRRQPVMLIVELFELARQWWVSIRAEPLNQRRLSIAGMILLLLLLLFIMIMIKIMIVIMIMITTTVVVIVLTPDDGRHVSALN